MHKERFWRVATITPAVPLHGKAVIGILTEMDVHCLLPCGAHPAPLTASCPPADAEPFMVSGSEEEEEEEGVKTQSH